MREYYLTLVCKDFYRARENLEAQGFIVTEQGIFYEESERVIGKICLISPERDDFSETNFKPNNLGSD